MRSIARTSSLWPKALCAAALALTAAGSALSQNAAAPVQSQAEAREILMRMAAYLGGAQAYSVSLRAGYDVMQKSGQKVEFNETRKIILARPDKLRVEIERSDGTKTLVVFNGKEIVLVDAARNVYATSRQPGSIDDSVVYFVKDLGMRLPLGVMLMSRMPAEFEARVKTIDYVEKTSILGAPAHHLAARGDGIDFQVWVADGGSPVPLRVVITYRKSRGQPQFWAQFSDWNLAPAITDATFTAQVPAGAQKIGFAAQLPRAAKKGTK
ncbi:MAG TPA: DUF2092 domain-containing protein [Burkholderiales bacterium]|nr:DUF2092 domain-containing protein [Burkholderiales bacterium]